MRSALKLQHLKKWIILFMIGLTSTLTGYVIYMIDPVQRIVSWQLALTPNSLSFSIWKKPPIDVLIYVYVFNITNPAEFLRGDEKLKLEEVGPFVYQEFLENRNITWNENGTLTYVPYRNVIFVPEKSIGNPEDVRVNVPNIPMLGISSTLSKAGFFVNYPFTQLINYLDSKPILNLSIHEYFWGYEDSLVTLASGVVPSYINFAKFGLLDRMYDEGINVVNINTKTNPDMLDEDTRYLAIETYNYSPGLANWGYRDDAIFSRTNNSVCNKIKGATESALLPPNLDKRAKFRVFRKAFCRTLPVVYKRDIQTDIGVRGFVYQLADNFLDTPDVNPDNECYCRKMDKCLKKGLSDMTPCYYNIPAAMSLPHFLDADPSLLENVEGLKPVREKHETTIIVQPDFGLPISCNSRMQTNLVMREASYSSRIAPFNGLTIPLFWNDLRIPTISDDFRFLLRLSLIYAPAGQTAVIYLTIIAGIVCVIVSIIGTVWAMNQPQQGKDEERRESIDFRIPLDNGQYTAIRILPSAFRKITSRSNLFN